MRILYVSQYYPPEIGAPAVRVSQLAAAWRRRGHEVTVLTGFPNHPTGRLHPRYARRIWRLATTEDDSGVRVLRTWLWPAANRRTVRRSLNYLSFALSASVRGALVREPFDWVIATSPQLLCGAAGEWLARRHRTRFCFEVRDLWPESLEAVGAAGPASPLYRFLDRLAQRLYARADLIAVVTESFRERLLARSVPGEKVAVVPNAVNLELFRPQPAPSELAARLSLEPDSFVVGYLGTLGMAHGLETVLEAARLLAEENVSWLLVGEGAEKARLVQRARALGLTQVRFLAAQPYPEMPSYLALCSAVVVPLRAHPLFETVLPSKLFEAMACERPVIVAVAGEARRVVERARAGLCIEPNAPTELAAAVRQLADSPAEARAFGQRGRAYVESHHNLQDLAEHYLEALEMHAQRQPALLPSAAI